jgi:hypothetical protein
VREIDKYLKAPIFESRKSNFVVRYRNETERQLMMRFDESPKVKDYFQPLNLIAIKQFKCEKLVRTNFCIEYLVGGFDFIYIESKSLIPDEAKIRIFLNSAIQSIGNSGLIVIGEDLKARRIPNENLEFGAFELGSNYTLVNFEWVN